MRIAVLALLALLGMEKRNQKAAEQLQAAKEAYQSALAKTGDFDCIAPEFDAVLKMFESVPAATPSKKEARDFVRRIREKRAAKAQHLRALDAVPVPKPTAEVPAAAAESAAPASDPASCRPAKKRLLVLAVARKKAGKPPLGTMAFSNAGEVAYAPGAEPSVEEAALQETLKACP
jgi:hypothetical protein